MGFITGRFLYIEQVEMRRINPISNLKEGLRGTINSKGIVPQDQRPHTLSDCE